MESNLPLALLPKKQRVRCCLKSIRFSIATTPNLYMNSEMGYIFKIVSFPCRQMAYILFSCYVFMSSKNFNHKNIYVTLWNVQKRNALYQYSQVWVEHICFLEEAMILICIRNRQDLRIQKNKLLTRFTLPHMTCSCTLLYSFTKSARQLKQSPTLLFLSCKANTWGDRYLGQTSLQIQGSRENLLLACRVTTCRLYVFRNSKW